MILGLACYLNHDRSAVRVRLAAAGMELLSGRGVAGSIEIPGDGVAIVNETQAAIDMLLSEI
ncbi:MAG: hypothetical protein FJ011_07200 [Chloroflexi bacterium]|nr:hypothetical protein [Chloroflexota bacterium]